MSAFAIALAVGDKPDTIQRTYFGRSLLPRRRTSLPTQSSSNGRSPGGWSLMGQVVRRRWRRLAPRSVTKR